MNESDKARNVLTLAAVGTVIAATVTAAVFTAPEVAVVAFVMGMVAVVTFGNPGFDTYQY